MIAAVAAAAPASAANMLQALQSTRVVSCTEASWRMLGLSFAGWNAVASAGLALLALLAAGVLKLRGSMAKSLRHERIKTPRRTNGATTP